MLRSTASNYTYTQINQKTMYHLFIRYCKHLLVDDMFKCLSGMIKRLDDTRHVRVRARPPHAQPLQAPKVPINRNSDIGFSDGSKGTLQMLQSIWDFVVELCKSPSAMSEREVNACVCSSRSSTPPKTPTLMDWFYHNVDNLHFNSQLKHIDWPIPISSVCLRFKLIIEMQVFELIVSPPSETYIYIYICM